MKFTTAISAAAFILAPGAGFAMEPLSATNQPPYPDWSAIAKTGPAPQKGTEEPKSGQNAPESKGEPGLLEKAGQAVESITGGSAGIKEKAGQAIESVTGGTTGIKEKAGQAIESITGRSTGTQEEGATQMMQSGTAPAEPTQKAQSAKGEAQYPYPDWPAVAKSGPAKP
ncbi:MAG: hypothetical protein J2P49_04070 [Methylocapsa sp.]|nr:hypothetical protein [Methylocapsa sp.]